MNGYWNAIVQEVINKQNPTFSFRFTNTKRKRYQRRGKNNRFNPERYYLDSPYQHVYFTPQEAACLFYCRKNSRYKMIARYLGISARTVEFYLKNMRRKLSCRTKKELLNLATKARFFKKYALVDGKIKHLTTQATKD